MKILFLNIYQTKVERGAETFVKEVSLRLGKRHKVNVISSDRLPPPRTPVLWRTFLDPQGLSIFFFTLKNLGKILKAKYDVIIPLNGGWQPALVRLATWFYGGKMVISGQSGMGWDDRNNLWAFPDAFVALSSQAKLWAKKANPWVKVLKIPNGVDTAKFKPQGEKIRVDLESPVVLCVAALTGSKRIDLTIKAVSEMERGSLLVVGDGEIKREINELGKKLLGKRFKLLKLPFSEMPKVYRTGDVFTLASLPYHSFEIVLVEAMASGLAVVCNKDPIRREIVGRAGVLVDVENIKAYAVALEAALRLRWGARPMVRARKYDWNLISRKYETLFNKLTQ